MRMRPISISAWALLCVAACGEADLSPEGLALPYSLGARPALPFPSDDALRADPSQPTGLKMAIGAQGENLGDLDESIFLLGQDFVDTLNTLDGWSTLGPAFISTGVPASATDLQSYVKLVDLTEPKVVPTLLSQIEGETDYGKPQAWIEARPIRPLEPKHRHALIALRGLRTVGDEPFARSPTFDALYEAAERPERADVQRWSRARERQSGLQQALVEVGIDPEQVLVADPYTTLSTLDETTQMVQAALALPAPSLDLDPDGDGAPDLYLDPLDDPRGNVPNRPYPSMQAMLRVTFDMPTFRAADDTPLVVNASGAEVQRMERVEAIVIIPKGQGPFPVAVFHHGLGGAKESVFQFAEDLCGLGIATVAIDATLHGFRSERPGNAGVRFLNVVSPNLVLDNFRTAQVDQVTVVRAIDAMAQADLLNDGSRPLDANRLFYVGVSLGAIVGAGVMGIEPRFDGAVLFVGGSTLLEFFDRVLSGFAFDGFPTRMFTTVAQSVLDRGDPSNFVASAADKQVLLIQALQDTVVPAGATISLARAMDLPLVGEAHTPVPDLATLPGPVPRRGWTQFEGSHDLPVRRSQPNYEAARAQARHFMDTWVRTGEGEIR